MVFSKKVKLKEGKSLFNNGLLPDRRRSNILLDYYLIYQLHIHHKFATKM